jgi:hypothetical protein
MDQLSIEQKIEALRELKREKNRRAQEARKRAYDHTIARFGSIPVLVLDGPDKDAQRKRFLTERGNPAHWIEHEVVDPPPVIEPPSTVYAPDHASARDVTPPRRPPMPPPAPPPLPIEPPRNRALEAREAEQRRMRRFMDDDWKPHDGPLRYPRGRNGW